MWSKRKAYVARLVRGFKACSVVSRPELELARRVAPSYPGFVLIPNGVSTSVPPPQRPIPGTIIYAGSVTYAPNMDAVCYFAQEILPLIRKDCPEANLTVTGDTQGADLGDLGQYPGIRFVGRVEDIRSAVAASWCSVAPIRQGGGTRLKILESLSLGTPVVSTSKGVEGLELVPGRHFLLGDDPRSFADCVLQILRNSELRARIGEEGRSEVYRRYSWQEIGPRFSALVEGVVAPGSA
jgi:glycosyltransferase involved in cell wall biosynthesis